MIGSISEGFLDFVQLSCYRALYTVSGIQYFEMADCYCCETVYLHNMLQNVILFGDSTGSVAIVAR